jgi:hypothetical protein
MAFQLTVQGEMFAMPSEVPVANVQLHPEQ